MKDKSQHIQYKKKFLYSVDSKADLRILFELILLKNAISESSIAIPDALTKYFKVIQALLRLEMIEILEPDGH